jgi:hypothetical protein
VGHTHEDVDQMFSTFNIGLKNSGKCYSVEQFVNSFPIWYTKPLLRPKIRYFTQAWSWKEWIGPFLRTIDGTAKPHVFHLKMNAHCEVDLLTKSFYSTTDPWMGPYKVHISILCLMF